MFARVTTFHTKPGAKDEAIQASREGPLAAAREENGFKGFLILVDPEGNSGFGITLWESEGDLQASEGAGGYYDEQMARMSALLDGSPKREVYEVALLEMEA